jgi:hypothetical protein
VAGPQSAPEGAERIAPRSDFQRGKYIGKRLGQPANDEAEHFIRSGLRRLDRLPRLGVRVRAGRAARECRLTLVESLRSLSIPKSCHVGREALPSEERVRVFIEGPDLQRHKTDADFAGGGTYGVEQRAGDALSSMGRPHADMVQMDLVPGVAEWRFGQMNDLGIGVTGRLGIDFGNEDKIAGISEQPTRDRCRERIRPRWLEVLGQSRRVQALDVGIEQ